jgi:hypothetical protein
MNKIENERQYEITRKLIKGFNEQIEKLNNETNRNPNRKELILTSLEIAKEEIEQQLAEYESIYPRTQSSNC